MNKILFNFLVVGVALAAIQSASAMNDGEQISSRAKHSLRSSPKKKIKKDPDTDKAPKKVKQQRKPLKEIQNVPARIPHTLSNNSSSHIYMPMPSKPDISDDWINSLPSPQKKRARFNFEILTENTPVQKRKISEDQPQLLVKTHSNTHIPFKAEPKIDLFEEVLADLEDPNSSIHAQANAHEQAYSPVKHFSKSYQYQQMVEELDSVIHTTHSYFPREFFGAGENAVHISPVPFNIDEPVIDLF